MTGDGFAAKFQEAFAALSTQVRRVLVGQESALEELLVVLFAGGHALVEGVPGTGKTLLVRTLARAAGSEFGRIQFTPDLLPADILGCETLLLGDSTGAHQEGRTDTIAFAPGPIFTQFLLADEINRGTPRTQSALLEAMQEGQVTIAGEAHTLDPLFTVFATRNPIEMEGTYPLPEAQLDRFLLEIHIPPPDRASMVEIARRTTGDSLPAVDAVLDAEQLARLRTGVRQVIIAPEILDRGAGWIRSTQPESEEAPTLVRETVRYGTGVRALQSLVLAAKVRAASQGRVHVTGEDLSRYLRPVIRHRLILNLDGESRGIGPQEICEEILRA